MSKKSVKKTLSPICPTMGIGRSKNMKLQLGIK